MSMATLQLALLEPRLQRVIRYPRPKHPFIESLRLHRPARRRAQSASRLSVAMMAAGIQDDAGNPRSAPAPLEVLVYCGEGAGHHSARNTLRALQRCLAPGVEACLLDTLELLEGSWRERCLLFVMPGGADLPYCKHLNGHGNRLLRGYVAGGGSYLGICAGAYYACGRVEFEPGSPLEVVGDRELGFFPGTARGAAYPGFDYMSERGACAAPVRFRPLPPSQPRGAAPRADAPAASPSHGGGGSIRSSADGPPSPPPRLGRHHLELPGVGGGGGLSVAAVEPPRGRLERDVVLRAPEGGFEGRSRDSEVGGVSGRGVTHGTVEPLLANLDVRGGGGGECDGWVYCKDYSNGGPVFVLEGAITAEAASAAADAGDDRGGGGRGCGDGDGLASSSYAVQDGVEVLAVYPELGNVMAAVRCRVGEGVAVLCGTHPEMPHESLTAAVQLYDGQQARHVAKLGEELSVWEQQRRQLWAALLMACCTAAAATGPAAAAAARPTAEPVAAAAPMMRSCGSG